MLELEGTADGLLRTPPRLCSTFLSPREHPSSVPVPFCRSALGRSGAFLVPPFSPLCAARPLCFYLILHLSTSSAGFLCPAPFPWRAQWSICPGAPICFLVPSDNCEDGHWGCLSAEACFGESLTSGGFSSSGRKGEGGVLGCGHSCYGSVEPTALGTGSGRVQDEVMGVEDGGGTRHGQMSISSWLSSWDLDSELRCGFQSCVTLGQSLAQEQNGVVTKPSQVGWRGGEQINCRQMTELRALHVLGHHQAALGFLAVLQSPATQWPQPLPAPPLGASASG